MYSNAKYCKMLMGKMVVLQSNLIRAKMQYFTHKIEIGYIMQ